MQPYVFSCTDPIAILSFLARRKDACSISRILELNAAWRFQFNVEAQAESLLLTRGTASLMAVDLERSKMLRIYGDVLSFLFRNFVADEINTEAYNDIGAFCQSSETKDTHFHEL